VPEIKTGFDHEKFIREAIDELSQNDEVKNPIHSIAALIACHSARRAGDVLSKDEMDLLARNIFNENADMRCPHGRPFVHKISKSSLENIFKRKL
jgi:DNA mismatch repair protein MutL